MFDVKLVLIDIRVARAEGAAVEDLLRIHDEVRSEYPTVRQEFETHAQLQFNVKVPHAEVSSHRSSGYLFDSADRGRVMQARQRGFTFSRVGGYESWDDLEGEAHRLWEVYSRHAQPVAVTRLAVRFINELKLPLPFGDFREYILTVPDVAPGLPGGLDGFFLRLQLPFPQARAYSIVTESITPGRYDHVVPLIFDIEVFDPGKVDPSSAGIWTRLGELREVKNEFFFRSLTPKALEMYQ